MKNDEWPSSDGVDAPGSDLHHDALSDHPGLRERKKKLMRQLISDTATVLFLERGFEEVRVSEIAAACDVSEKTIYNYFPTKESLVLDREETSAQEIRRALGPGTAQVSPVDAVIGILKVEIDQFTSYLEATSNADARQILQFNDLIEGTPSLKAARADMIDRLVQVAAESLAARAAIDPDDPEPQIAADALLGLWRIFYRAIIRHSKANLAPSALRDAVMSDVQRAARLIDSGLWSFATVVQGAKGRQQFKDASDASNEARKQVLLAIKQARDAWVAIKVDKELRAREHAEAPRHGRTSKAADRNRAIQKAHHEAQEARRKVQVQRQNLKDVARRARKPGNPNQIS